MDSVVNVMFCTFQHNRKNHQKRHHTRHSLGAPRDSGTEGAPAYLSEGCGRRDAGSAWPAPAEAGRGRSPCRRPSPRRAGTRWAGPTRRRAASPRKLGRERRSCRKTHIHSPISERGKAGGASKNVLIKIYMENCEALPGCQDSFQSEQMLSRVPESNLAQKAKFISWNSAKIVAEVQLLPVRTNLGGLSLTGATRSVL